jgi:cystathionine beta-lyase/cystathionine gamma-synthase
VSERLPTTPICRQQRTRSKNTGRAGRLSGGTLWVRSTPLRESHNQDMWKRRLGADGGGRRSASSACGMNSATTMLLAPPAGGHIVTTTDCHRRTRSFRRFSPRWASLPPSSSPRPDALNSSSGRALRSVFFFRIPTNPYLRLRLDIPAIKALCELTVLRRLHRLHLATSVNQTLFLGMPTSSSTLPPSTCRPQRRLQGASLAT